MLAVVKKPHIEISADIIPEELISFLQSKYKNVEVIDDSEELIDISETSWFRKMEEDTLPGTTLKRYRKRAGLTQLQLAKKLGMVKQNISAMETGSRGISKATAKKLADIFMVSTDRFI